MRINFRMNRGRNTARVPGRGASGRSVRGLAWVLALGLGVVSAQSVRAAGQVYKPLELPSGSLNANFEQHFGPIYSDVSYPNLSTTGEAIFDSVPFVIPYKASPGLFNAKGRILPTPEQSNFWLSAYSGGLQASGTQTFTIDTTGTTIGQVSEVCTLMGCWWGNRSLASPVSVRFSFQDQFGTPYSYTKTLKAGPSNFTLYQPYNPLGLTPPTDAEIRDFHDSELRGRYSNVINGTTTKQVWTGHYFGLSDRNNQRTYRLDMQRISIPYPYNALQLTEIKVTDNGGWLNQRVFLAAATATTGHAATVQLQSTYANVTTGSYIQVYRVTNSSTYQWDGPVSLMLKNLTPGVTLVGGTGVGTGEDAGAPYQNTTGTLLPGQSAIYTLRFTKSTPGSLAGVTPFTPKILFGSFPR